MAADISPRYLSHKSVSRSPVAVQALVPDVIRVEQWPLYQDRRVQRHSCITSWCQACSCDWGAVTEALLVCVCVCVLQECS